jgi:hypothetical protein
MYFLLEWAAAGVLGVDAAVEENGKPRRDALPRHIAALERVK